MIHNIHDIINKYSLPIVHRKQSVLIFLQQYYKDFLSDLEEIINHSYPNDVPDFFYNSLSAKFLPRIKSECEIILDILKLDQKNWQTEKRKKFNELMHLLIDCGAFRELHIQEESLMSRIRQGSGPYDRKDMFHIPFSQRQFSSSQRFSIPGNPCLYLSVFPGRKLWMGEMFELSWMESGMPKVFNGCLYKTQKKLVFLHFAKKGYTYLNEYKNAETEDEKRDRLEAIAQYLLTFPMRAACFISIKNKHSQNDVRYYEEYSFPQLLMEWIQKNKSFDGVAYQSASSLSQVKKVTAYNIAMPIRDVDSTDGYDINLKESFKLSTPEKIDLIEEVKVLENDVSAVELYAKELEEKLMISDASMCHPYYWLLSICNHLSFTYSEIKNRNEYNMLIPFQQLSAFCHISLFVNKTIEHIQTAEEWIDLYKQYKGDTVLSTEDYETILKQFQIVNSTFQNMRNVFHLNKFNGFAFTEPDFDFI